MIHRPDIKHACQHCGCAVEAGEAECRRCERLSVAADLYAAVKRLGLDDPMTHNTRNTQ